MEQRAEDMRKLPFDNDDFDLIASNVAIQNISSLEGRDQSMDEACLVLRAIAPLLIADISRSVRYRQKFSNSARPGNR